MEALKKNSHFERVFSEGTARKNSLFILYLLPNRLPHNRIGICVGKALGKACTRNRIKRVIREILRTIFWNVTGFDIVLIARKAILTRRTPDIRAKIVEITGSLSTLASVT